MSLYLDNAATTYTYPEVAEIVKFYSVNQFYNPSAIYSAGSKIKEKIEEGRYIIARFINAKPNEIIFTSGGTESDNWACDYGKLTCGHIITSTIEHKAILKAFENYKNITYVKPDCEGVISPYSIEKSIKNDTTMISVMMANNEIGTIEPIDEIGFVAKNYNLVFHTDAVQAFGHIPIDVKKSNINIMSASSHKFHGPKGCGFIYVDKKVKLSPYIVGGGQENGMRSGTENVPGILGMVRAAELSYDRLQQKNEKMKKINMYIKKRILSEIDGCIYNGSSDKRLPNNLNFCFRGIDSGALITLLDMDGIYVSGASACNRDKNKSYVLTEIGVPEEYLGGSIRITIDERIGYRQADFIVNSIKKYVYYLRNK